MLSQLLLTILALAVPNGAKGPDLVFRISPSPVQEVQFFDSRDRVDVEAVGCPKARWRSRSSGDLQASTELAYPHK